MNDSMLELISDVGEIHHISTSGRTFNFEVVSVILQHIVSPSSSTHDDRTDLVESLERFDEEEGRCEPDRSSPIRISTKPAQRISARLNDVQ